MAQNPFRNPEAKRPSRALIASSKAQTGDSQNTVVNTYITYILIIYNSYIYIYVYIYMHSKYSDYLKRPEDIYTHLAIQNLTNPRNLRNPLKQKKT